MRQVVRHLPVTCMPRGAAT